MKLSEICFIMDSKKNGTFGQIEAISDKSSQLAKGYKHLTVIKKNCYNFNVGLDFPKVNNVESRPNYDANYVSDYHYLIPKKVCYHINKNGEGHYFVDIYPNSIISNTSTYYVFDDNGILLDIDLHEIMQPSYFKTYTSINKRDINRIPIEHIINIK